MSTTIMANRAKQKVEESKTSGSDIAKGVLIAGTKKDSPSGESFAHKNNEMCCRRTFR